MTDSQNEANKCFSGILRRLLCTGSLPTHPSEQMADPIATEFVHLPQKKDQICPAQLEPATTPGIVARLMGLESIPAPKGRRTLPDLVPRSRSVNCIDNYLIELDPKQTHHHRRVRTSVSFRDHLQQQNHDFFIFCLDETDELDSKLMKTNVCVGELKQRKAEGSKKKENVRERRVVIKKASTPNRHVENKRRGFKGKEELVKQCSEIGNSCHGAKKDLDLAVPQKARPTLKAKKPLKPKTGKEVLQASKLPNKKKSKKVEKIERISKNSTTDSGFHAVSHKSPSEDSRLVFNLRSKSSPNFGKYDYPHSIKQKPKSIELGSTKSKDCESVKLCYTQRLCEMRRLTENDLKESNWSIANEVTSRFEDYEEICMEFGQHIFDVLLHQVIIDELAGMSH